ncbi:TIM44-like domain-containing protein [Bradyrhizobium genosp. L]|uniref:Tim44 domain-containing protein n=1 Tax=Bradyrhizobium genosp. L TaxID=83637 RepID=UPI0018A2BECE|nr:TIM44-like domain-containing protein [Bradyrhizobium genosp. L]QPF82804.1 TIM44-like domain-containing protein [Bradyrhizobium genosp. L]
MNFSHRTRGIVRAIAVVMALALPVMMTVSAADARAGSGGSRGSRTFSAPPSTNTAPGSVAPLNRTFSQPNGPGMGAPAANSGGLFGRPGMGRSLLGGLAAGFLGAGLFGMLFGGGLFSGLGGLSSILGLILQIGLIVLVVRFAMSWWQRRNSPSPAYAGGPDVGPGAQPNTRSGFGFGLGGGNNAPVEITPADYEAFERLLGEIQTAWSNEDIAKLHTLATPEMVSYFSNDLQDNKARNVINKVTNVKLLQGDLAEAWREGDSEYATVAMRYSLVDVMLDRNSNRLVGGSEQPQEVTDVWTFLRQRGGNWELSAIQETN